MTLMLLANLGFAGGTAATPGTTQINLPLLGVG